MTHRSILASVLVLTAALMAPACGGEGGGAPTGPLPTAVLTIVASPNPVVGALCGAHCGNLPGEREALTDLTSARPRASE